MLVWGAAPDPHLPLAPARAPTPQSVLSPDAAAAAAAANRRLATKIPGGLRGLVRDPFRRPRDPLHLRGMYRLHRMRTTPTVTATATPAASATPAPTAAAAAAAAVALALALAALAAAAVTDDTPCFTPATTGRLPSRLCGVPFHLRRPLRIHARRRWHRAA